MRKSFGAGRGMGGGGGGGGGGTLRSLRTVQRSVRASGGGGGGGGEAQEPFSQSKTTSNNNNNTFSNNPKTTRPTYSNSTSSTSLSLSSSSNFPLSAVPTWLSSCDDEFEWECINGTEDEIFVFGTVPSKDEAQHAVSALQQVLRPAYFSDMDGEFPSSDSNSGWIEPSLHLCNNSTELQPRSGGSDSVHEAFRLLQTEPSVQRMVVSLSSDKAVWDAVLNNEVVRELRASLYEGGAAENTNNTGSKDEEGSKVSNAAMEILSRIFFNTKAKVVELIEKITEVAYNLFRRPTIEEGTTTDPFEEKLRTSFLLSVVVFLVVAVYRSRKA